MTDKEIKSKIIIAVAIALLTVTLPWLVTLLIDKYRTIGDLEISINKCQNNDDLSATCKAECPLGEIVISGGCNASQSGNQYTQIHTSEPMDDYRGWYCKTSADMNHQKLKVSVVGYSFCVDKSQANITKGLGWGN